MSKPPAMRMHATGQYTVHYAGRDHYLGRDKAEAEVQYRHHLKRWADWRDQRAASRTPAPTRPKLIEVIEQFFALKAADSRDVDRYYRKHLRRYVAIYGSTPTDMLNRASVQALKDDMLVGRYKPRTINHDIGAVKNLMAWLMACELMPYVDLAPVKKMPTGQPPDKSLPFSAVAQMKRDADEKLRPWLGLNYLCLMRPSEVIRVVQGEGEWIEPGIFRLDRGKMDRKTSWKRHVVFNARALHWLSLAKPHWSRLDSYSSACRYACGHGPGRLRHSAATHLNRAGISRADTDLLLGHTPPGVSLTYFQVDFRPLLEAVRLLFL